MLAGEQRDDPVGLAQLLGAQHDALVAVQAHPPILPRSLHTHRSRTRPRCMQRSRVGHYDEAARLTALTTALSEAVTMLGSMPTPHRTRSPTAHSR